MKIHKIEVEVWKLDGGAMFGLVPKTIWSKQYTPDENNALKMSTRLMLIETDEGRKVLVDTGMGNKRGEKYYQYKYIVDPITLEESLAKSGFKTEEITDVVLTHLHDDHVGGAVRKKENGFELVFEQNDQSFLSGYNRFDDNKPMYGWLKIIGNPVKYIC